MEKNNLRKLQRFSVYSSIPLVAMVKISTKEVAQVCSIKLCQSHKLTWWYDQTNKPWICIYKSGLPLNNFLCRRQTADIKKHCNKWCFIADSLFSMYLIRMHTILVHYHIEHTNRRGSICCPLKNAGEHIILYAVDLSHWAQKFN